MNVDPAKMREMAAALRNNASTMASRAPIAQSERQPAVDSMDMSMLTLKAVESLAALDSVVKYHARRINEFCDAVEKSAEEYEQSDNAWASDLMKLLNE